MWCSTYPSVPKNDMLYVRIIPYTRYFVNHTDTARQIKNMPKKLKILNIVTTAEIFPVSRRKQKAGIKERLTAVTVTFG